MHTSEYVWVKKEYFEIVRTKNDKVVFTSKNVWVARLFRNRGFGRRRYSPANYHIQSVENGKTKRLLF
jgi:hypothetical protein